MHNKIAQTINIMTDRLKRDDLSLVRMIWYATENTMVKVNALLKRKTSKKATTHPLKW